MENVRKTDGMQQMHDAVDLCITAPDVDVNCRE